MRRHKWYLTIFLAIFLSSILKVLVFRPVIKINQIEARLLGPLEPTNPSVIQVLKTKYLLPPSRHSYNLSTDPSYKKRAQEFSWPFVHEILKTLFEEERSKFFVEAGGFDGEFLSNTVWLEKNLGWTGLLVEPQPQRFQEMVYKRRKCWIANACLSDRNYPYASVLTSMETKREDYPGLDPLIIKASSYDLSAMDYGDPYYFLRKLITKEQFAIQCFPLESFMAALNQTRIDFLSLDVEGTEFEVFATIPLDKVNVRTIVFENYSQDLDYDLIRAMNKKGFNILDVGGAPDYFFVNARETELIEKYRRTKRYLQDFIRGKKINFEH